MTALRRIIGTLILLGVLGLGALMFYYYRYPAPPPVDPVPLTGPIDRILIEKADRRLTVYRESEEVRSYRIALGFAPEGGKVQEGDGKTPEGLFRIDRRNENSAYHLSLGLDYPHPADTERAMQAGYSPGGDIFIHGQPNAMPDGMIFRHDWTAGCIALRNAEIEELWRVTRIGTEVEIRR